MTSHTICAKYIPSTSLDYFNTLLNAVEPKNACDSLITFHLETFSCRMSRADKQHFENQRRDHEASASNHPNTNSLGNTTYNGSTPNVTPYAVSAVTPKRPFAEDDNNEFGFDNDPPVSSQSQQNSTFPAFSSTFPAEGGGATRAGGNTPPNSPQIGVGLGGSTTLSPQTITAAQSGRPCFPEFFVIPNDIRSSHISSSAASPMGFPYGSSGSSGQGQLNAMGSPEDSAEQQQQVLSANWYGVGLNTNNISGSDSANNGAGSSSSNNQPVAALPPTFRLPDADNGLSATSGGMGARSASVGGGQQQQSSNQQQQQQQFYVPATREEAYSMSLRIIADRLIYLVGALNSLYGTAEYDFSVLGPKDFVLVNPVTFISEVNSTLAQLPADVLSYTGQHGEALWRAVGSMIGGETNLYDATTNMSECDVFLLNCPSCDPAAQTKMWSSHYFIYHKRNRVIISVIMFGEAAHQRGSDGNGGSGEGLLFALGAGADDARRKAAAGGEEYYIDSYGNTHYIGGDAEDDDAGADGIDEKRRRGERSYPMSPTSAGAMSYGGDDADTPQYVQASLTDVNSDWGNDDAMA